MSVQNKEELDYLALQIIPVFMEQFKQYCTNVGDIELASSLTGVNSLPALMNIGGVYKVVEVPLSLITKLSEASGTAAEEAAKKANASAVLADAATAKANTAAGAADSKGALAETAAGKAETKALLAENAASNANLSAERANTSAGRADGSADNANAKAEFARMYGEMVKELAEHPIKVGADNYVYTWNLTTHTYDKTDIYVRGEGFSVKKVFTSVAEMEAYEGTEFKEGDFALINMGSVNDPDTAKLYSRNPVGSANRWRFLVDMSGAIGFTGKTPQFVVGTVVTGGPNTPAGVSLTPRNNDAAGNPVFALNITIPKGDTFTFSDLTPEQVKLLQQPAEDMIKQLQAVEKNVTDSETLRVAAEEGRADAEALRVDAESGRDVSEKLRDTAEGKRDASEKLRAAASAKQQQDFEISIAAAGQATAGAILETQNLSGMKQAVTKATGDAETATGRIEVLETGVAAAEALRVKSENSREVEFLAWGAKVDTWEAAELKRKEDTAKAINDTDAAALSAANAAKGADEKALLAANAAKNADTKAALAQTNALLAKETAENPPKVVDDFWWVYDASLKDYVNSGLSARGRSPKIVDLVWWVWNDVSAAYENTFVSVNDSFQLTKKKIEDLLTGEIGTHTHDGRYSTKEEVSLLLSGYVQAVAGKQLSTEDFTTALKNKLTGLSNYDDTALAAQVAELKKSLDALIGGGASSAIDTFNEIKAFLEGITDTSNLAAMLSTMRTEIVALIPTKLSQLANDARYVVDAAYVHTDYNYTKGEKDKLAGIESGANKTVVDAVLSDTSLNPVQGKVLFAALGGKSGVGHKHSKSEIGDFPASLPASDVYAWAKAATKPAYTYGEISGTPNALKNPYALTVTKAGVTIATYDGAAAKSIEIPDSVLSLPEVTGSGNVVTGISVSGLKITLTKGITALTGITKAQVEGALTGNITTHEHTKYLTSHQDISGKLDKSGGILTGDLLFNQPGTTGIRQIQMQCGGNDYGRLATGATATNVGWLEIATADDGNEPIYVRQYIGTYATAARTATLLDESGNTFFPGTLTANIVKKNGGKSTDVMMADGSVVDKGSFSVLAVNTIMESTEAGGDIFGEKWLPCDGRVVNANSYPKLKAFFSGINGFSEGSGLAGGFSYNGIAFGNGLFVCVGESGKSDWSVDGKNWNTCNALPTGLIYGCVTFGNGLFVCMGYSGNSAYSTDGKNWNDCSGPGKIYPYNGVAFGNGLFVCVGEEGRTAWSVDGKSWYVGGSLGYASYKGIAFGNGLFVCVGSGGNTSFSIDGKNWSRGSGLANLTFGSIIYGNGMFVCVASDGGRSGWSVDGKNWFPGNDFSTSHYAVTYGNGLFVCVGYNGSTYLSIDGKNWSKGSGLAGYSYKGIAFGNGLFVCVGEYGKTYWATPILDQMRLPKKENHYIKALD